VAVGKLARSGHSETVAGPYRGRVEHGNGLDQLISWRPKVSSGRWVFVEAKPAHCRECGMFLEHSWNYFVGSRIKLSLCTGCVAEHVQPG
jgi:hypothetical protein